MRWLHPEILWALFALLIPIAIHLFNFRRFKPIYFSNVKWLKEVQLQTKKQSQLKQLLLLLSRLLLFTAIILAFAEPYFPSEGSPSSAKKQFVSIYIDNSFSMDGQSENGRMLDIARQYGYELIEAFGKNSRFQIVNNQFEGKDRLWISREEAIQRIDEIQRSPSVKTIEQAYQRMSSLPPEDIQQARHNIYLISDFQQSTTDLSISSDSVKQVFLIPIVPNQIQNLSVDSVWFENPVQTLDNQIDLKVRIYNYSDEMALSGITTTINGKEKGIRSIRVNPRSYADSSITIRADETSEIQNIQLSIDDYPVTYDNTYFLSTRIDREMRVLEIFEESESTSLRKLFSDDPFFKFSATNVGQLLLDQIDQQDLIVLTDLTQISSGLVTQLSEFVADGGTLTFFPSKQPATDRYANFLSKLGAAKLGDVITKNLRISPPDLEHPLYRNVFSSVPENWNTPQIKQLYEFTATSTNSISVLHLPDESSILEEYQFGKGTFYQFTVALDTTFSDFRKHPLFVPTLINMAINAEPTQATTYTVGQSDPIFLQPEMMNQDRLFTISNDTGNTSFIPEYRIINGKPALLSNNQPSKAGFYQLSAKEKDSTLLPLAFNYDRKESDPTVYTIDELENLIIQSGLSNLSVLTTTYENLKAEILSDQTSIPLWKWLIAAALLFALLELIIIRFYKS